MSLHSVRRSDPGGKLSGPAGYGSFPALELAVAALDEGDPDRPIALADGVYVRARFIVSAFADSLATLLDITIEPQSISADLVERIRAYAPKGAA